MTIQNYGREMQKYVQDGRERQLDESLDLHRRAMICYPKLTDLAQLLKRDDLSSVDKRHAIASTLSDIVYDYGITNDLNFGKDRYSDGLRRSAICVLGCAAQDHYDTAFEDLAYLVEKIEREII